MATKTATPPTARLPVPRAKAFFPAPPTNLQERLDRIEDLGQRIAGYVQSMCQAGNSNGASIDAREKAVRAFYEQMVVLDRQLCRIYDDFQLE